MEKKIPFSPVVVLADASYLDRVGRDVAAHFAPVVGRELPKADLALLLECLALDAGVRAGENEVQVIFVYAPGHTEMGFCTPSSLDGELHGKAFRGSLGEFSVYAFQPSGLATVEELFMESLELAAESREARRLIVVPDEGSYGPRVAECLSKVEGKDGVTLFGMNPPACGKGFAFEMLGFPVLQSLGIRADEL